MEVSMRGMVSGCLFAAFLLLSSGVSAQNLVQNPNFDSGFTNWTASTSGGCATCSASLDASNGFPTTPSARLVVNEPSGSQFLSSDCIVISPASMGPFDFGVFLHTNSVTGTAASNVLGVFYTDAV